jgi:hypothetical protein
MDFSDVGRMVREYWELFLYAAAKGRQENLLTGIYADGWVGPFLSAQIVADGSPKQLELLLAAPTWLPYPSVTLAARHNGTALCAPLDITRGTSACWVIPLMSDGDCEIRSSRSFVPARTGESDDRRELSVIVQRCSIRHADGGQTVLFPEEVTL